MGERGPKRTVEVESLKWNPPLSERTTEELVRLLDDAYVRNAQLERQVQTAEYFRQAVTNIQALVEGLPNAHRDFRHGLDNLMSGFARQAINIEAGINQMLDRNGPLFDHDYFADLD